MEVIVRAEQGLTPPSDTFVALRVGQVQKQARFAPTCTYCFDEVGSTSKANAKLEVFRRVGHTTITFGGTTGDIQDVEVPIVDGKAMRMRLCSSSARGATPAEGEKRKSRQVNNARSYLAKHNLEDLFKDAMKEVMKLKPMNPHEFLAAYILGRAGKSESGMLPKIFLGPEQQVEAIIEKPQWLSASGSEPILPGLNKPGNFGAPRTLPPIDGSLTQSTPPLPQQVDVVKLKPAQPMVLPFADYYRAFFCTAEAPDHLARQLFAPRQADVLKLKPAQPMVLPFSDYYCAFFCTAEAPDHFARQLFAPRQLEVVKPMQKPASNPCRAFQQAPSVGTWCTARQLSAPRQLDVVKLKLPQPSVLPFADYYRDFFCTAAAPDHLARQLFAPRQLEVVKPRQKPASEVVEVPQYRAWTLRPSVGTWCAPLPSPQPTDCSSYRKWQLSPSVGTWCAANPIHYLSLDDLATWRPGTVERDAMGVILKGRQKEIRDLTEKLSNVAASLGAARDSGSATTGELKTTAEALERCVGYAQNEYDALEQWSVERGFSKSSM